MKTPETIASPPTLLPEMDHEEAVREMAVEKYLLQDMTPAAREQFEAHFFGCMECAADVRATSAFLTEAKKQLGGVARQLIAEKPMRKSWVMALFRPAFVSPVFAAMLLLIVFQNFFGKGARPDAPEVLPSASLVGGNSRGGTIEPVAVINGKPILLSVDIPTQDQYSSYELALNSPAGATLWHVPVSAEQAKDTVSIRVSTAHWVTGEYRLIVYGHAPSARAPEDLANYRFNFSNEPKANTGR